MILRILFIYIYLSASEVPVSKMDISPIFQQIMILSSSQLAALSVGGAVTYPTILMERFRTNDSSIELDIVTKSWIGSMHGFAGIPAILMPMITQKIGRKWGYIITCVYVMIGWILAYKATTATELLISESFHGLGTANLLPVCFMAMTEMLAPQYRHLSMQTFGIVQGIGMSACGILGRYNYIDYKTICLLMLAPIVAAIALALMWTESPSWFAYKGKFDKCEQAFVKLRGTDDLSRKELEELITAQRENLSQDKQKESMFLVKFLRDITSKDFYQPSIHIFVFLLLLYWSGIDVIYVYFIEIVTKSSHNENAVFYASITMYLIVLGGFCITRFLIKNFKHKTILTTSGCAVIIFLLCSSLVSGLQTLSVLSEDSLLLMYCLLGYSASASVGLHSLVFNITSELMPVKHRSLGGALYIVMNCILSATSLKLSPFITLYLGLWCTFVIYAVNASLCLWCIWKYVPETKGRSLQEIEDFYMFGSFTRKHYSLVLSGE